MYFCSTLMELFYERKESTTNFLASMNRLGNFVSQGYKFIVVDSCCWLPGGAEVEKKPRKFILYNTHQCKARRVDNLETCLRFKIKALPLHIIYLIHGKLIDKSMIMVNADPKVREL